MLHLVLVQNWSVLTVEALGLPIPNLRNYHPITHSGKRQIEPPRCLALRTMGGRFKLVECRSTHFVRGPQTHDGVTILLLFDAHVTICYYCTDSKIVCNKDGIAVHILTRIICIPTNLQISKFA